MKTTNKNDLLFEINPDVHRGELPFGNVYVICRMPISQTIFYRIVNKNLSKSLWKTENFQVCEALILSRSLNPDLR